MKQFLWVVFCLFTFFSFFFFEPETSTEQDVRLWANLRLQISSRFTGISLLADFSPQPRQTNNRQRARVKTMPELIERGKNH
jgi:hypothetical protein